ncbi:glyceraldehyde-3-phosphate:ferredoxin oxidoreductase [Thermogladius calderae 1633]|uniref:Glyceraldehyde-3-phosphate:ferredoxin oxidoreductase n=1 Tax=Thermogladius calderae (strain DSM 22663 / VKM B-2946 / 1633) TaxID=1184251 RepID=I3TF44_THEC1|nr:aldehyde ferredoxin oxidoreductase N-terminal domain-containing protein [Thermogladius calderae]AFK51382.1 glyceraldehyde-3-phosphate:ferredoxin oxidoreductase [Thermogladius calderae 1633]
MSLKYRVVFVNPGEKTSRLAEYDLSEVRGPVSLGVKLHSEVYESWKKPVYHPDNALVIGTGLVAGSKLYGVHRLVAVFRSPLTRGLHVAAMGGAAYQLAARLHSIVVDGAAGRPTIVLLRGHKDGAVEVSFSELEDSELESVWRGYRGLKGTYALTKYVVDKHPDFFKGGLSRVVAVGPASKYTSLGALFSATLFNGEIDYGSEDLAARGGPGSVLLRAHNVAAIAYSGSYDRSADLPREMTELRAISDYTVKKLGKPYINAVIEAGTKYRFDPKLNTGGTFGSNYPHLRTQTPMFNWNMIYLPNDVREKLFNYIMKYYWEPFNKEAIESKSWKTCGEPCPVACKKVRKGKYKTDYEPYNGLGPMIGVFDLHEAERLVELADAYGFDAIELGNLIAFVFEALENGLLRPEEVSLSRKPSFNPLNYTVEHSKTNADLAEDVIESMAWGTNPILRLIADRGLRSAAKVLDLLYEERTKERKTRFVDLAVYASFGEEGHITPNFYWTPGMVAPLPVLGRYWTLYTGVFLDPEEFAAKSYERAVMELMIDDSGVCRFHRGWAEKLLPSLYADYYGLKDTLQFYKRLYKRLAEYQSHTAEPTLWESRKVFDYMTKAAAEYANKTWTEKFSVEGEKSVVEWWARFKKKLAELVSSA